MSKIPRRDPSSTEAPSANSGNTSPYSARANIRDARSRSRSIGRGPRSDRRSPPRRGGGRRGGGTGERRIGRPPRTARSVHGERGVARQYRLNPGTYKIRVILLGNQQRSYGDEVSEMLDRAGYDVDVVFLHGEPLGVVVDNSYFEGREYCFVLGKHNERVRDVSIRKYEPDLDRDGLPKLRQASVPLNDLLDYLQKETGGPQALGQRLVGQGPPVPPAPRVLDGEPRERRRLPSPVPGAAPPRHTDFRRTGRGRRSRSRSNERRGRRRRSRSRSRSRGRHRYRGDRRSRSRSRDRGRRGGSPPFQAYYGQPPPGGMPPPPQGYAPPPPMMMQPPPPQQYVVAGTPQQQQQLAMMYAQQQAQQQAQMPPMQHIPPPQHMPPPPHMQYAQQQPPPQQHQQVPPQHRHQQPQQPPPQQQPAPGNPGDAPVNVNALTNLLTYLQNTTPLAELAAQSQPQQQQHQHQPGAPPPPPPPPQAGYDSRRRDRSQWG